MRLGKKLQSLRKELKISQEQLAEKLDVTRQTISKWELEETHQILNRRKKYQNFLRLVWMNC